MRELSILKERGGPVPEVSVIMPVYNGEAWLEDAMASVLNQSYGDFELIVVDDGSRDRSPQIVRKFTGADPRVMLVEHGVNRGAAAARNTAIRRSSGRYLMMTDADDIQHPDRLKLTLELAERERADMVFHDYELMDESGQPLGVTKGYPDDMDSRNALLHQLRRNQLCSGLALVRNTPDVRFDESLACAEDFELFLRLLLRGYRASLLRRVLTWYRRHGANLSSDLSRSNRVVKTVLSRLDMEELERKLVSTFGREEAALALAAVFLWRDQPGDAARVLEGLPFSWETEFYLGVSYYKKGDFSRSLRSFEKLDELRPDAAVRNNLGVLAWLVTGNRERAGEYFASAIVMRPGYLDAARNAEALARGDKAGLRFTERPLRSQLLDAKHYARQ